MPRKPKAETADNLTGVDHARNLEHALDFYRAAYPSEWLDEQNYPFGGHVGTVIARLQNK